MNKEREKKILEIAIKEKSVTVKDLAQRLYSSEPSIRRDLCSLEKQGLLKRTHGGAVLNENLQSDMPLAVRKRTNVIGKQKIAELVADRITDNMSVMLDSSSTALFIARRIKDRKNLTIITNSLEILIELKDAKNLKIFSSGGLLGEDSFALVGNQADKMISGFHVNASIISCKGFDIDKGFTDSHDMHASTKRVMLENCDTRVLAVDSSKFDHIAFNVVGTLSDIDVIVTDVKPPKEWLERFEKAKVECVYPNNDGL